MAKAIQVHTVVIGKPRTLYIDCSPKLNGTTELISSLGTPSVDSGLTIDTATTGGTTFTINNSSVPQSQWFSVRAEGQTAGDYWVSVDVTTNSTNSDVIAAEFLVCVVAGE